MPAPRLSLDAWCAEHMRLSRESSAAPGKFEAWPFQREPMVYMSPSHPAEKVVLLCASQTMKTQLLLNFTAFVIANDPGPVLIVEPTEADAESFSKDRITPMLRDTPALKGLVTEAKSRDAGNTIGHKQFRGGALNIVYATSPSQLAMRPIRYLLADEVSRYGESAGKEGDPVGLAEKRTVTFWNRKMLYSSSPGNHGKCRISDLFEHSDQRQWEVPCPHCQTYQTLEWTGMVFSEPGTSVDDPHYRCAACESLIPHAAKHDMNAAGRWRVTNPEGRYPGFRLNGLVSPVRTWADIVAEWKSIQGRPEQLKVFVNTVLAETWREQSEAPPEWRRLYERREQFPMLRVPKWAVILTAGVDIQKDRIEYAVWAWGKGKRSALVDFGQYDGDTSRPEVWQQANRLLEVSYPHELGAHLQIAMIAIDSGDQTTQVYDWARKVGTRRVRVVKGNRNGDRPVWMGSALDVKIHGKAIATGHHVWHVQTTILKDELYRWLKLERPTDEAIAEGEEYPPGYVHFPEGVGEEFLRQLCSERAVKGHYEKLEHSRNEQLDMRIYARAAAIVLQLDKRDDRWFAEQLKSLVVVERLDKPAPERPVIAKAQPIRGASDPYLD